MSRSSDGIHLPLSERGGARRPGAGERSQDGRPCWVRLGDQLVAGTVHAWRRDQTTGKWEALVVAWMRADEVSPRDEHSP